MNKYSKEGTPTLSTSAGDYACRNPGEDSLWNQWRNSFKLSMWGPLRHAETEDKVNEADDFKYLDCCLHQKQSQILLSSQLWEFISKSF